ncbi:hypothetical protein [Burkholderia sp. LMG 21824]
MARTARVSASTLPTVAIDTDACVLDYVAGNPHDLARDGARRF